MSKGFYAICVLFGQHCFLLGKDGEIYFSDYGLGYLIDPSPGSVKTLALISSDNDHCGDGKYFYFWF